MKKIFLLSVALTSILVLFKCKKDDLSKINSNNSTPTNKTNYLFDPSRIDTRLFERFYNNKGNYCLTFSNQKGYPDASGRKTEYSDCGGYVKFNNDNGKLYKVNKCIVDDYELSENLSNGNFYYSLERSLNTNNTVRSFFGKNTRFRFEYADAVNRNSDVSIDQTLYIPQEIIIDDNQIKSTFGLTSPSRIGEDKIDRNGNYAINWNPDINNQHGIVILTIWNGFNFDENHPNNPTYIGGNVINIDIVDDNGVYVLTSNNFKDMPVNGIISISIMRIGGYSGIATNSSYENLFVGMSSYGLPAMNLKN